MNEDTTLHLQLVSIRGCIFPYSANICLSWSAYFADLAWSTATKRYLAVIRFSRDLPRESIDID